MTRRVIVGFYRDCGRGFGNGRGRRHRHSLTVFNTGVKGCVLRFAPVHINLGAAKGAIEHGHSKPDTWIDPDYNRQSGADLSDSRPDQHGHPAPVGKRGTERPIDEMVPWRPRAATNF